jgi:hypothetical protein
MSGRIAALVASIAFGGAVHAQVLVSCDTQLKWAYITEQALLPKEPSVVMQGPSRTLDAVDTSDFVVMSKEDNQGNVFRIRSKSEKRSCGPYSVVIRAGWFNANPMGEKGADDFSVVELWRGGKRELGPVALGACEQYVGRSWGECPADWATSITLMWGDQPIYSLKHEFEEWRRAP